MGREGGVLFLSIFLWWGRGEMGAIFSCCSTLLKKTTVHFNGISVLTLSKENKCLFQ